MKALNLRGVTCGPSAPLLAQSLGHQLVELILVSSGIDSAGAVALAHALHQMTSLSNIAINITPLKDEGAVAIIESLQPSVRRLNLLHSGISHVSSQCLISSLPRLPNLKEVILGMNPGLGTLGARAFLDAFAEAQGSSRIPIQMLEIGLCGIQDDDKERLRSSWKALNKEPQLLGL